ncbi:MAG: hypothetical protein M1832_000834 [Thelocarpon impressellum]|nr:MAG: hypothetical protein M1832_000834 [Thelocarpon impressellum]
MAEKYLLRVTAGPSYDPATHKPITPNSSTPTFIETQIASVNLNVRIQDYRGLPRGSPSTSPYFSEPPHTADQYSISFTLLPKVHIPGDDLVFGNDFDRPIRDRLPPGFGSALKIVKWAVDPGIDGDPYADEPYLYGPALSSVNVLRVGEKREALPRVNDEVISFEEGGFGDGEDLRKEAGVPEEASARKKHFLQEKNRQAWTFERARLYQADFFNPYLDFNRFALRLPGFTLSLIRWFASTYRNGCPSQPLRYVLKNRKNGHVLFVIVFTLLLNEDVEREEAETKGDKDNVEGKIEGERTEPSGDDDVD